MWYNNVVETITRNVRDLGANDRTAVERLVGHSLRENQQLIIQVVSVEAPTPGEGENGDELPPWCRVFEGLSDADIQRIEKSIVRSHESREFP